MQVAENETTLEITKDATNQHVTVSSGKFVHTTSNKPDSPFFRLFNFFCSHNKE